MDSVLKTPAACTYHSHSAIFVGKRVQVISRLQHGCICTVGDASQRLLQQSWWEEHWKELSACWRPRDALLCL